MILIIVLSTTSRGVTITSFASVFGAPVGITIASFSFVFLITTEIVKKILKTTQNKKKAW